MVPKYNLLTETWVGSGCVAVLSLPAPQETGPPNLFASVARALVSRWGEGGRLARSFCLAKRGSLEEIPKTW